MSRRETRRNPRRCIATGATLAKPDLVRFAVSPDDTVLPDVVGKLPGRGIWVKATSDAVETAVSKRLFHRAARRAVKVPPDLVHTVEMQLAERIVRLIAMARKSGTVVAGYTKVRNALVRGRVELLLQASDGSQAQLQKVRAQECNIKQFRCLTAKELGIAFNRDHVIHAAVESGGVAARLSQEAHRLTGFRA